MNKQRRLSIVKLIDNLTSLKEEINDIKDIEEEIINNLVGFPQFENKVVDTEIIVDSLELSLSSMDEVIDSLSDIINN